LGILYFANFCPGLAALWGFYFTATWLNVKERGAGMGEPHALCSVAFTMSLWSCPAGRGAMAEVWTIVESVRRILEERGLPTQS